MFNEEQLDGADDGDGDDADRETEKGNDYDYDHMMVDQERQMKWEQKQGWENSSAAQNNTAVQIVFGGGKEQMRRGGVVNGGVGSQGQDSEGGGVGQYTSIADFMINPDG